MISLSLHPIFRMGFCFGFSFGGFAIRLPWISAFAMRENTYISSLFFRKNCYICRWKRSFCHESHCKYRGLQIPILDTSELQIRWNGEQGKVADAKPRGAHLWFHGEHDIHTNKPSKKWTKGLSYKTQMHTFAAGWKDCPNGTSASWQPENM